jgi:hypothetical protein
MKRFALILCAVLGMTLSQTMAHAGDGGLTYGGWQPWWNCFNKKNKCLSPEEQRLQQFWHDYYDALRKYYGMLDHIDWVAYYKNHGYQINAGCVGPNGCPCNINYAPVFVSPSMQWAIPNNGLCGPMAGPGVPMGGMCGGPMHY